MQIIDLRGVSCPTNFVKAKLALEPLAAGTAVALLLDDGEALRSVPRSLRDEGHRLLGLEEADGYHILTLEKGAEGVAS